MKDNCDAYFCNLAACLQQLDRDNEAVAACCKAIAASPTYVKAFLRRARSYENMGQYQDAIRDLEKVLEIDAHCEAARNRKVKLEHMETERIDKLKTETMAKLKDLGNSLLGNFGLSTDNFKFEKDPTTGGYNMQFVQNP